MLFCTGSTGILGAIGEGVNGDSTVLLTKSVMDIFAAFAFAAHMGPMIACIAIPPVSFFQHPLLECRLHHAAYRSSDDW